MKKLKIALIFGGPSTEHEVSVLSARNIVESLNPDQFEVTLVSIDKWGSWKLVSQIPEVTLPGGSLHVRDSDPGNNATSTLPVLKQFQSKKIDAVFPILHGNIGEDGSIQGLLRLMDIPYVGPDILGSAVGLDKDVSKRLLRESGLPVAHFITIRKNAPASFVELKHQLGLPFVIKPASCGSSVGVSVAQNEKEFEAGLEHAFKYDSKVIIEEHLVGRELECGVMGNEEVQTSEVGEITPKEAFYSYKLKYIDEDGARMQVPADITPQIRNRIQELSRQAFKILCCEGMARVDFFLTADGRVIVNEINTIPGFTKMSMFPVLWNESGISYGDLVAKLVDLAIERHQRSKSLKLDYSSDVQNLIGETVAVNS